LLLEVGVAHHLLGDYAGILDIIVDLGLVVGQAVVPLLLLAILLLLHTAAALTTTLTPTTIPTLLIMLLRWRP